MYECSFMRFQIFARQSKTPGGEQSGSSLAGGFRLSITPRNHTTAEDFRGHLRRWLLRRCRVNGVGRCLVSFAVFPDYDEAVVRLCAWALPA